MHVNRRLSTILAWPLLLLGCGLAVAGEPALPDVPAPAAAAVTEASPGAFKVPSQSPTHLARDKALARMDLATGRFGDAYYRLRPQVAGAGGDVEYLGLLALAALRSGHGGEALVIYQRLTELQPERGGWHIGLALAREHLGLNPTGDYREALALTDAAEIRRLLQQKLALHGEPDVG